MLVGQHAALWVLRVQTGAEFWFSYANPLMFAPYFLVGLLIYRHPLPQTALNFGVMIGALAAIALVSLLSAADVYRTPWLYLGLTILAAATVAAGRAAIVPKAIIPVVWFFGEISYALYLTHWFSYRIAGALSSSLGLSDAVMPILFALIAISLAALIYYCFEKPVQRAILARANTNTGQVSGVATQV